MEDDDRNVRYVLVSLFVSTEDDVGDVNLVVALVFASMLVYERDAKNV